MSNRTKKCLIALFVVINIVVMAVALSIPTRRSSDGKIAPIQTQVAAPVLSKPVAVNLKDLGMNEQEKNTSAEYIERRDLDLKK